MATILLTLKDTAAGGVSIQTSFRPALGQACTPAQGHALDIISRTHKQWGLPTEPKCECDLELTVAELVSGKCASCGRAVMA